MLLKTAFEKLFKIREQASRSRPGADDGYDAHEKPFLDHLEDLRITLMKIAITLVIFTILAFTFHIQIFDLVQYPAKITEVSEGVTLWERTEFITLAPQEMLMLMLKVSFFAGIIVSFPIIIVFLFQFILPGLKQVEKKAIVPGATVGFLLFLTGVSFAFFLAAPIALKFFYVFENERISKLDPGREALEKPIAEMPLLGVDGKEYRPANEKLEKTENGEEVTSAEEAPLMTLSPEMKADIRTYVTQLFAVQEGTNLALRYDQERDKIVILQVKGGSSVLRIGEYIKFITRLVLVFGISFQLPVVVTILVKLELLTARVMRSTRSYAWIIILVSSAIMTPPDIMTLGLLAGPMIILYEICIVIASIIERRREKKRAAEEAAYQKRMAELHEKPADDLTEEEKEELHKAEIEQYEKDHADLYKEDSEHVPYDPHHGDDHSHDSHHDEGWHDDHGHWHEGTNPDHDEYHHDEHADDPHHGEEKHEPVQDWPDRETLAEDGMESDHAESEHEAESSDAGEDQSDDSAEEEDDYFNDDGCDPEGPVVDLNHAEQFELETLPGVGPKLAELLIANRPYETFDDVERVPGISAAKLQKMMDRLMLG